MKCIITILSLLFFVSCSNDTKEIIKVGVVAPLTGEGATYGQAMKRGADLVFDNNNKYKLIYEDSKLQAKEGINGIQKLISIDKVQLVYGAAASSVTLAMAPIAEREKIILFSSISTADEIKNSGEYIFRNVPRNEVQGYTAAEFLLNKLGKLEVGVLFENDDYGLNLANSFTKKIEELGGKIVAKESYLSVDNDFKTQLFKLKNQNIQGLFIPGNYEESSLILKQARELNINIPIIGGDGSYSPKLIQTAGTSAEGFYCTIMAIDEKSTYYNQFYDLFVKKYSQEPNIYDAYAYEANMIIMEALNKVGNNANKIKEFLLNTEFNSLTGVLDFNEYGEVIRNYSIVQVTGNKFEAIDN